MTCVPAPSQPLFTLLTGLYPVCLIILLGLGRAASAQSPEDESLEDSTVVFEAEFFKQFQPVSVNDMIDRIPSIGLALGRGGGGGRRGLGGGGNEILINGQRITGKSNGSRDQLRRIAASQVRYIEIIRGTSEEIDVRGSQVINIVLVESASRSSLAAEINADLIQDGTVAPGGRFSYTGQSGQFNYLFAVESEPDTGPTTPLRPAVIRSAGYLRSVKSASFAIRTICRRA